MSWVTVARQQYQEAGTPDDPPTNLLTTEDYTQGPDKPIISYGDPKVFLEALDAVEYFYCSDEGNDARIRTWVETLFAP